ncbi:hypothetical protein PAPYR_1001 [Paratrimastix pyriformis]|uniref:Uncharacterized protein n=1 Tax=Paratrimastix pyriformis TaxID=342808 RepID=A0ABQ8UX86_9EUKA|nr:hypothetical protein PAPYR_1001 [Paratrimastix pyriformis]
MSAIAVSANLILPLDSPIVSWIDYDSSTEATILDRFHEEAIAHQQEPFRPTSSIMCDATQFRYFLFPSLMHYSFPSTPLPFSPVVSLQPFPEGHFRFGLRHSSFINQQPLAGDKTPTQQLGNSGSIATNPLLIQHFNDQMNTRCQSWIIALRSLYYMVRNGRCPRFYIRSPSWTVSFVSATPAAYALWFPAPPSVVQRLRADDVPFQFLDSSDQDGALLQFSGHAAIQALYDHLVGLPFVGLKDVPTLLAGTPFMHGALGSARLHVVASLATASAAAASAPGRAAPPARRDSPLAMRKTLRVQIDGPPAPRGRRKAPTPIAGTLPTAPGGGCRRARPPKI